MKPLLLVVLALALTSAESEVKELTQSKEPIIEAEDSEPQTRAERCTTCTGGFNLGFKSPNAVLAEIQQIPGAEIHTQQSFEGCSSDRGCAGLKVKDGRVIEKFGNVDAFRAAAAADSGNEFQFHAAGNLANVFEGGIPNAGPYWWMNENSPFKNTGGGNFEKFSKSSSSFSTTGGAANGGAAQGAGLGFGASLDLSGNPFLNGDFSKIAGGFSGGQEANPGFQSSSFESSSFSTSSKGGEIDLSKNPYLNGGFKAGGFQAQAGFGAGGLAGDSGLAASSGSGSSYGAQTGSSSSSQFGNKFTGYTGSSPSPFTASTAGSNVNLIQNAQKSEFDFEQQQQTQQNIDEIFQGTGNVHAHDHSGGELQQTCAGQGYVCVHKAQCNNGVVNTNGAGLLQAKTKKQYCNTKTEICCRIEISSLTGAGGLQGSLGVGSATFQGAGSQGSGGLFVSSSQGNNQGGAAFGAGQGSGQGGSFGSSSSSFESSSSFGSRGNSGSNGAGFGAQGQGVGGAGGIGTQGVGVQGTFGTGSATQGAFGAGSTSQNGFNAFGSGSRGVTVESGSSSFESSRGSSGNSGSFGGNKFGAAGTFGNNFGTGATLAPAANGAGSVYKTTSQTNFVETDSFSSGSENQGVYRPGTTILKPGIPYLPPVDSNSASSGTSNTSFVSTARPIQTPRPTYLPPVSTAAPGYLPPVVPEQSIYSETRVPGPTYTDGSLILDETRPPARRPSVVNLASEIPSGCAAALKCTPIEFCTAEGVISNTTVALTRDQEAYRVPLTDCKDLESGRIGKCCRDPYYTDPWPVNQLGKWVDGVFGGNDGKYTPDSRGSGSISRPGVTVRPPVTGSSLLNNFRTPKPTLSPFGPNQVTPGFPATTVSQSAFGQKGQFEIKGQGQFGQGGQGQFAQGGQGQFAQGGQGQFAQGGQGQFAQGAQGLFVQGAQGQSSQGGKGQFAQGGQGQFTQGAQGQFSQGGKGQFAQGGQSQFAQAAQGQFSQGGKGQFAQGGQGQFAQGAQGQFAQGGQGQFGQEGQGQFGIAGQGAQGSQSSFGQSSFTSTSNQFSSGSTQLGATQAGQGQTGGQGQLGIQGQGQLISQGQGQGVRQGQGQTVSQGQGSFVQQGAGQFAQGGRGQFGVGSAGQVGIGGAGQTGLGGAGQIGVGGLGQIEQQGQFSQTSQTQKGFGQAVVTGQGQSVSQGFGSGVRQGSGFSVSQGGGFNVENEYSESVQRVFLSQYTAGGSCGLFNGQKPYGNRNENEVDFAEIPWQAMVLLQTNKSLLCGGVITRPDVVITSASCVDGLEARNVLIKGGEWKLGIDDEPLPFQIVQVKTILRHPFYKRGSFHNDAAILVLSENLRFAKNIYPICLPRSGETLDAFYNGAGECVVTGWGKQVLQAHLAGAIMHSLNVSLLNPGECQNKLQSEYPHLLQQYDQESCACGVPTNPTNNICRVDIGSALACTTDSQHFELRGIYSWDSGCQLGNQLAAFFKFDLEWYEWAIGLIESARFAQFSSGSQILSQNRFAGQIKGSQASGVKTGVKGGQGFVKGQSGFGAQGFGAQGFGAQGSGAQGFGKGQAGFGAQGFGSQFAQGFSQFSSSSANNEGFGAQVKVPLSNSFSASFSEKKVFQTEPKIVTYTTKPEIVTFTTKPEYFTFTTKPKIVTYTTKPQIITYETSGSGTNPQYVAPGVTFNPGFTDVVGAHTHNAQCKCEGKK